MKKISIIGAGLAGSEAAYYLLKKGYEVHLYERRPKVQDGAHESALFGELVCSNSLKNKELTNACGLLKGEMKILGSIMMEAAAVSEVPSGNALGVDRELFASYITDKLKSFPNLILHEEEVLEIPEGPVILATGPLTGEALLANLGQIVGEKSLSFFDASAPIVKKDSINFEKAYFKSRYDKGDASYINCPFNREEYYAFINALVTADKALLHEFDTKYFEACLPVEVIASRGPETLRHGPLKPVGLEKPDGSRAFAVVQLRQDTKLGDYYNIVGFQTNLTYPEQRRVFRMIPGLENAEFLRYGLMHRNAYINAPKVLSRDLTLKERPNVYIAGQLSGVEGYVESAAMGILAAIYFDQKENGKEFKPFPRETILGALNDYIVSASSKHFAPMNANWALLPPCPKDKREELIMRSLALVQSYQAELDE